MILFYNLHIVAVDNMGKFYTLVDCSNFRSTVDETTS